MFQVSIHAKQTTSAATTCGDHTLSPVNNRAMPESSEPMR